MDGMHPRAAWTRACRAPGRTGSACVRDACIVAGIVACQAALAETAPAAASSPPAPPVPMGDSATTLIMIGIAAILAISWMAVIRTLRRQNWNLGLALSEEADLPAGTPPPAAGQLPPMVPSTSRLIALMGLIVFSAFFIGVGFCVIWALCHAQPVDRANAAWTFFISGSAMFLPYGANKFADAFR